MIKNFFLLSASEKNYVYHQLEKKLQIQLYFSRIFIRYPVFLQQDIKIMNSLNHRTKFSPQFLKIYLFIFQKNHS